MKTMIAPLMIGLLIGAVITFTVLFYSSPSILLKENKSNYDFQTTVEEFEKSVKATGWLIPVINDLQKSMSNAGKDVRKVKVYEICKPEHAYKVLSQDDERIVSSLMPCRVAFYEKSDGSVYFSRMNSGLMAKPMNKIIRTTMADAAKEIEDVLNSLISGID
jgi:uncharacterized protein (DUF302 family)